MTLAYFDVPLDLSGSIRRGQLRILDREPSQV